MVKWKNSSDQKQHALSLKSFQELYVYGQTPEKSILSQQKEVIEDTTLTNSSSVMDILQLSSVKKTSVTQEYPLIPKKKDLDSQQELFKIKFPDNTIVTDIGSGINFKRKGLLFLLEQSLKGNINELIITHKDRLCRFGFEIISKVIEFNGGKIVVLYDEEIVSPEQELVRDLISITTVFSSRLYGLRSHSLKRQIRNSHKKGGSGEKIQNDKNTHFSDGE